ncbi:MAG: DUF2270 domain-containing protein [Chloroflexota bacterium]|nr:DUF2270 domain-containing protein [Chloroflexota bacterium]
MFSELGPASQMHEGSRAAQTPRSANAVTALVHFYRGEMGRLTAYRVRLDTTTNWALTSSALVGSFVMGNSQVPHAAFLFVMFMNSFFLLLEARRFRAYETSRQRVQLIERCFYPEVLGYEVDPGWIDQLLETLRNPTASVNQLGALSWRLRRTYLWIYGGVLATWLGKLYLIGAPPATPGDLVERALIGPIPGWITLSAVGLFYAGLFALAFGARRIYPMGDEDARRQMEQTPE